MNIEEKIVSSPELAEMFGVTDRYIRMLAQDGVVKKSGNRGKYLLAESVKGFIEFIKEQNSADVDLKDTKLKKETEKSFVPKIQKKLKIEKIINNIKKTQKAEEILKEIERDTKEEKENEEEGTN